MPKLLSRDQQPLNYIDIGPRTAPTCILVHGFGMQAHYWLPLILPLSHKYRFILPDLRGFGGSIRAQHTHSQVFDTFADDLNDLMTELGLYDVCLAGYSMGGMTAVNYQRRHGTGRLSAYLQIDQSPVVHNTPDWPWGLYGAKQAQAFGEFNRLFEHIDQRADAFNWASFSVELKQQVLHHMTEFVAGTMARKIDKQGIRALHRTGLSKHLVNQANWPAYLHCMRQYMQQQTDLRSVFDHYDIPLWVFAGERSELYDIAGQQALAQFSNNSRLITFDNDGHALPFESPFKFVSSLSAFISSNQNQCQQVLV